MNPNKIYLSVFFSLILILSAMPGTAEQKKDIGLGIIIGEPTGISFKYGNFPVIGLAWSLDSSFHLHCDYWLHDAVLSGPVKWFVGAGIKMKYFSNNSVENKKHEESKLGLGVRVPIGLQYFIIPKIELFGEIAPGISLIPSTDFDLDIGIGARYHF